MLARVCVARRAKQPSQEPSSMSKSSKSKILSRERRRARVRAKVSGTVSRPRLAVFRSLQYTYAQLIDDVAGKTLAQASSREVKENLNKVEAAKAVGKMIAERASKGGIKQAVFDRGGYKYHGRVQAVAESARENGLEF